MSAREPVTRKRAIRCMMLNLFLLPGAGSLVGGRRSGWWQMMLLALSLVMIAPLTVEMLSKVAQVYESLPGLADDTTTDMPPSVEDEMMGILKQRGALAIIGVVLGLISWTWAFFTGISLLTESGQGDQEEEEDDEEEEDGDDF